MNLPPISSTFATSLAGSVKAAGEKASADAAETNTVQHQAGELQVDGIIKSNASDDSEADGRQLLDTFERRSAHDEGPESEEPELNEQAIAETPQDQLPAVSDRDKSLRPRLDLQA